MNATADLPVPDLLEQAADRILNVEGTAYEGQDAMDAIGDIDGALEEMVAVLRRAATHQAALLRALASQYRHLGIGNARSKALREAGERMIHGLAEAVALARAVLGETSGGEQL